VNLNKMKLLKCKNLINKLLFNVKFLFVTMFVIFSLVRKIIKSILFYFYNFIFLGTNNNTQLMIISKGESIVFKISRNDIMITILIYIY
jgi:hypothetical protein